MSSGGVFLDHPDFTPRLAEAIQLARLPLVCEPYPDQMRHSLPLTPQFYVTAPQPCPYLPGRMERKLFTALQGDHAQKLNDTL